MLAETGTELGDTRGTPQPTPTAGSRGIPGKEHIGKELITDTEHMKLNPLKILRSYLGPSSRVYRRPFQG